MVRLILTFLAIITCTYSNAQFTDRYWVFGDSAGIDFKNLSNPVPASSVLQSRGTCASICDGTGDLLFYCGTPYVYQWIINPNFDYTVGYILNRNHQLMQSGDSLVGAGWYQEMIIVPDPGDSNRFYVFSAGVAQPVVGLYYSIVDLSYNGGLGKVVQKNVQLRGDTICDGITAVRHGNGRDWWVLVRNWRDVPTNEVFVYLVDPGGVTALPIQNIGYSEVFSGFKRFKFNLLGNRLYEVSSTGFIGSMDFDRCTGQLSNQVTYCLPNTPYLGFWGFEVSPDENYLYTSLIYQTPNQDTSYILQFDLNVPNFLASADTLATLTYYDVPGLLELGPDGKIYISIDWAGPDTCFDYLYCFGTSNTTNSNLSVINYPDSAGAACGFQPFSFNLGGHKAYVGLPNNHNYELGAWVGSPCDTLSVGIPELFQRNGELKLYYDKSWQTVFVNAEQLKGKNAILQFYSTNGQLLDEVSVRPDGGYITYGSSFAAQPDGMYIVRLQTEKEVLTGKFVKW